MVMLHESIRILYYSSADSMLQFSLVVRGKELLYKKICHRPLLCINLRTFRPATIGKNTGTYAHVMLPDQLAKDTSENGVEDKVLTLSLI